MLTARENIGFGRVDRLEDLELIKASARKADIHENIERLPGGYETYMARQFGIGSDLSGGEWQRMGLARAYMRDAAVVVLDEPTASLDPFSEYKVYRSFAELMHDKIAIVISHRFSNVRMADHIVVLDAGKKVEKGTHEQLTAEKGLYAEMFGIQADRYR